MHQEVHSSDNEFVPEEHDGTDFFHHFHEMVATTKDAWISEADMTPA